jgi:hypothetical protein
MDDLARALEVTVRYRVEAAAEHRDARVARRRAIVQRERLLRAGASLRQLLHRRCRHSRHHREQEAVTDGTTYICTTPLHGKARGASYSPPPTFENLAKRARLDDQMVLEPAYLLEHHS